MDVEFMVTDSLEAIRPKMTLVKNIEDAASVVEEMFASTVQGSGGGYFDLYTRHVIHIFTQLMVVKAAVTIVVTMNALPKIMRMTRMRTMAELPIPQ